MRDIGFYIVATGFVLGVAYGSFYAFSWPIAAFIALLFVLVVSGYVFIRRPAYLLVLMAMLALCTGGARAMLAPKELPRVFSSLLDQRVSLEGTVVAQPDKRETSTRLTVEAEREDESTRLIAVVQGHTQYYVGDRVSVSGTLALPEPFATAGGRTFAYDTFLAKDGVFALVDPSRVIVTGRDSSMWSSLMRRLQAVRDAFMRAVERAIPEPESALAAGLIVGGKQGLGKALLADFTVAGLLHIVVLSGYNVTIVAEAVLRALGFLPRKLALSIAGMTIGLFVLAAGAGSAATRAGAMALLGLVARTTGRTYVVLRALAATVVGMLLWNPLLLVFDPGFQFSLLATLGLVFLASPIERAFAWIRYAAVREITASTFAAQIGVLPILLFQTGNLSLVSFIVNVIVLPVVPLAMGLATLASFVALAAPPFLEAVVVALGLPAYVVLAYVINTAHFAAQLPLASMIVPVFPFWVVVVAYALLGFLIWRITRSAPASAGARIHTTAL